ncbi:potential fungal zinc cluster transcription factor [Pseudozyma hubeiensis SY62]|uniref:Potential fungal zinc cluster transcription factor n=1 Tax=Pseudozyma hubeiensis (strain SY62) TaxID=1305764 RepID=R9P5C7_PSEHS|nr:potential fungal zinc cluster transcription factor [Pseudozyma hubeiensis SY62]GAC96566.1 potential fungal zinc cluster transcription factor [Pseudozyma hubeiensis SY62]
MLSPRSSSLSSSTPSETEALLAQIASYLNLPSASQPRTLAQLSGSPQLDGQQPSSLPASVSAEATRYDPLWQPSQVAGHRSWRSSSFSSSFLDAENSTSWDSAPVQRLKRRFGATCDHCRSVHLRCDLPSRSSSAAIPSSLPSVLDQIDQQQTAPAGSLSCSRCQAKGLRCTMTPTRASERTTAFNRSGSVIQKARSLHGSLAPAAPKMEEQASALITAVCAATAMRPTAFRITDRVMARSLTVRMLNCYFAVCHVQLPVVDYVDFRARFNAADGDPRRMSMLANAGRQHARAQDSSPHVIVGTPASTETLLAVLVAWAARYTDAPLAFGVTSQDAAGGSSSSSSPFSSPTESRRGSLATTTPPKRKRKRGVACDSCRLRRVRCDITEVVAGSSCSRCLEKGIYCTDEYIRSTQAKSKQKTSGDSSTSNNDGDSSSLSVAFNAFLDTSPSLTSSISLRAWMPSAEAVGGSGTHAQRSLAWRRGRQRKAFCLGALQHALDLANKHDLVNKPSVECIQVLTLLYSLVESIDPAQGQRLIRAACSHLEKLGLTAQMTLNLGDSNSVVNVLRTLQAHRSYTVPWCMDAIASVLLKRAPCFALEWIVQFEEHGQQQAQRPLLSLVPSQMSGLTQAAGVGLSITSMLQLGAVARSIGKHILMEQRVDKLQQACHTAWFSVDSVMSMSDRSASCVGSALDSMPALHPLGWVGITKVLASLLHLAIFRALSEQCAALAAQNVPDDLEAMQMLQSQGMLRAIESCRRTSHFIKVILPLGIIQFRGSTFKQIPHLAKFLAQVPTVAEPQGETDFQSQQHSPPMDALHSSDKRQGEVLKSVEGLGRAQLGPFTTAAKQREVEWLIAALLQLGYAWDEMPDEANDVQSLLHSQGL